MLAFRAGCGTLCHSFQAPERNSGYTLNQALLSESVALHGFPIPSIAKEADTTVPEESVNLHERVKVIEETTITWKQMWTSLGVFTAVVLAISGLFYRSLIPNQISAGITDSPSLKERFGVVHDELKSLGGKIDKLQLTVSATLHPKIVAAAIKDITSGDKASLTKTLPNARNLLEVARQNKIPIPVKDMKEISKPLFGYYKNANTALKHELWLTFIGLANTKASTDSIIYPLSEGEITKAKAANNYFENADIDLSTRETWKDTVFKNCKISVSAPDKNLILDNVRFFDDEFQMLAENETSRKLFQTVVENDTPTVSAKVAVFSVGQPVVKETNPVTK